MGVTFFNRRTGQGGRLVMKPDTMGSKQASMGGQAVCRACLAAG